MIIAFGERVSRFKPRTYTLFFITCDVVSLIIQASGAVTTSMSDGDSHIQHAAINIMVTGIAFQVASLAAFMTACAEFSVRVRRAAAAELNPGFAGVRATRRFKLFLWALGLATLNIFIRSVFRCVELKNGFQGKLANNQVTFMILEGAMVITAVLLLTAFHPGVVFGSTWKEAHWHLRRKKESNEKSNVEARGTDTAEEPQGLAS